MFLAAFYYEGSTTISIGYFNSLKRQGLSRTALANQIGKLLQPTLDTEEEEDNLEFANERLTLHFRISPSTGCTFWGKSSPLLRR